MTELASDNFDRADNADLGASWDTITTGQVFLILSNAARPTSTANDTAEIYNGVSFPNDQYAEIVIGGVVAGGLGEGCGVVCRAGPAGTFTAYRLIGSGSGWEILRFNGGVSTPLTGGSSTGTTFATNDVLRLEVRTNGANCDWIAKKNTVQIGSGSDTSPIASGSAGVAYSSSDVEASILSWAAGDFESAPITDAPEKLHVVHSGIRFR